MRARPYTRSETGRTLADAILHALIIGSQQSDQ
jgi:hypothetical protein